MRRAVDPVIYMPNIIVSVDLLARARTDAAAQEQVRKTLRKPRFLFPFLKFGKRLRAEAETALSTANPAEPAREFLLDLLGKEIRGI